MIAALLIEYFLFIQRQNKSSALNELQSCYSLLNVSVAILHIFLLCSPGQKNISLINNMFYVTASK